MIRREDILSLEYLKKTEFTGSHRGLRYRLEPFNFVTTPDEQKQQEVFAFSEDGILDAVAWMNDRLFEMESGLV